MSAVQQVFKKWREICLYNVMFAPRGACKEKTGISVKFWIPDKTYCFIVKVVIIANNKIKRKVDIFAYKPTNRS